MKRRINRLGLGATVAAAVFSCGLAVATAQTRSNAPAPTVPLASPGQLSRPAATPPLPHVGAEPTGLHATGMVAKAPTHHKRLAKAQAKKHKHHVKRSTKHHSKHTTPKHG